MKVYQVDKWSFSELREYEARETDQFYITTDGTRRRFVKESEAFSSPSGAWAAYRQAAQRDMEAALRDQENAQRRIDRATAALRELGVEA